MSYKLITIGQKDEWTNYIKRSLIYDFYHTWYYHSLVLTDEPFLFVYEENNTFIVLPLLKRKVSDSIFFDCTSVYGYAGPISNVCFTALDVKMIKKFKIAFQSFLKAECIVCVFSRLHPMLNQHPFLEKLGGLYTRGKTVAINLQTSIEFQRMKYRKAIRSKIRQLREKGFIVKEAKTKKEIKEFIKIYRTTMMKVHASSYYYFNEKYFFDLLNSSEFESKLLLTYYEGEITSGALVTFSNHIMQLHLAATKNEYLHDSPMKVLIDEASIIGRKMGMHYLHLGGGVGGMQDGLYNFKTGFSDLSLNFHTWQYIADQSVYMALANERGNKKQDQNGIKFPLYRSS